MRLRITYLRLGSTGHSGKHGHEFLEFEYSHGRLRYANNSNYRNDSLIRKESAYTLCFCFLSSICWFPGSRVSTWTFMLTWVCWTVWVGPLVVKELKRIIESSEITK